MALDVSGYKIKMSNEGSEFFFPPLRTFRNKHLPLVMHRMYIWYTVSFHNVSKVYKFTWNMKFIDIYYIIVMNHLIKRQPRDTMKSKNVRDVVAISVCWDGTPNSRKWATFSFWDENLDLSVVNCNLRQ